jgi:uncharacterized protein DUF397
MSRDDISKAAWRRSSRCNGATACVLVALLPDGNIALRDSKQDDGPVLVFTPSEWAAFVAGVQDNEFDLSRLYALPVGDGSGVDGAPRASGAAVARVGPSRVSR